jgi:hypothetical protein
LRWSLNPAPKRVVAERHRSGSSGDHDRGQPVLKVPGVIPRTGRIGLGQGVPVVVIGERGRRGRGQLVRHVVAVGAHALRGQPIPRRVIRIALRGRSPLDHLGELIQRIIRVLLRDVVEQIGLGRAIAGRIVGVAFDQRGGKQSLRHAAESVIGERRGVPGGIGDREQVVLGVVGVPPSLLVIPTTLN